MTLESTSRPGHEAIAAARRVPLNVLLGVPDDDRNVARASTDGKRLFPVGGKTSERFTLRGSANIVPFLSSRRFAVNRLYLQLGAGSRFTLGPGAILNHIADADICSQALDLATTITRQAGRPCFNHPAGIARTTRDAAPGLLAGIPGLSVPKTIRVQAGSPAEELRKAAEAQGLRYPMLVRVVGSHGGQDRIHVERPQAMDEIAPLKRKGRELYLTEFRDFAGSDGLYRKFRIVMVGEDMFVRHCVIGEHWSLHAAARTKGTEDEERAVFDTFDSDWAPALRPIFLEIGRRFDLDYFGVDCSIDRERRVLLFEANACMKILLNTSPSPNMWDEPIARIRRALQNRLASPETWRHRP